MTSLLSVNNLGVKFQSDGSEVIAVDGIDFEIKKGEKLPRSLLKSSLPQA